MAVSGVLLGTEGRVNGADFILGKRRGRFNREFRDALTRRDERFGLAGRKPVSDGIGVANRRRKSQPLNGPASERLEARKPHTELPTPFRSGQIVDLVHHHGLNRAQHGAQIFATEHELECLGRGHQEVRWFPRLFGTLRLSGIAVANIDPQADGLGQFSQAPVNVPIQGPKRCDVEDGHGRPALIEATMEQGQNPRHGFSRSGGGDDETIVTFHQIGHDVLLHGRWFPPFFLQRSGEVWMKP